MNSSVAILGSGNIGTDLMVKIVRAGRRLRMAALVGVDPASDGLAKARSCGVTTTHEGIAGLKALPCYNDIALVFDATSAGSHAEHDRVLQLDGKTVVDLTPAAIGPFVVPVVNLDQLRDARNVNMVTCGGQATIPVVAAVSQVAPVHYAEIVATISSRSAGPGTRANIDEFTVTTAQGIERIGGARRGKAIIVLNPADPPILMRDTVVCLSDVADERAVDAAVRAMVARVQKYVPGYRLKQDVQFERLDDVNIPGLGRFQGLKSSVFLEIEGAADHLPAYAGNLDIMTSAALAVGERLMELRWGAPAHA